MRAASALDLQNERCACARPHTAMSNTTMSSTTTHSQLSWKQADDDVHVATRDGEFAGFVEIHGASHLVRDNHGAELGSFRTLVDARHALEGSTRRRARSFGHTLRRHLSRARARARA